MCQINSSPVLAEKVVAYRVYETMEGLLTPITVSYYRSSPITEIGVSVPAWEAGSPFHAFSSLASAYRWLNFYAKFWQAKGGTTFYSHEYNTISLSLYEVTLEDKLEQGIWSGQDDGVTTITGYKLTLVRELATFVNRQEILNFLEREDLCTT
ncbi:MAG: hypothetical protein NTZ48_05630 [Candidatus Omnitrophica bacterium]|nr:hypothetical protein [Candidatus Omnitrophota bacterium]